jgi:hypothetical protein
VAGLLLGPAPPAFAQASMIMAMGHAGGRPLDTVVVNLSLITLGSPSGDPQQVAGFDLKLQWDSGLADLEALLLTEATDNWLVASNPEPGLVAISMASLDPTGASPAGSDVLGFRFRLKDMVGQTTLHLFDTRVFDIDQVAIEHMAVDGRLDVGVVAAEKTSLSRLKTLFAESWFAAW